MRLKKALKDFYISEVNICYKDKIKNIVEIICFVLVALLKIRELQFL